MPKRLPIPRKALRTLSLDQLTDLKSFIHELIENAKEEEKHQASLQREILNEEARDNKTYRLVLIRCGKENCRCTNGAGHGPYWYAFWSEHSQTRCQYIGKKLPEGKRTKLVQR